MSTPRSGDKEVDRLLKEVAARGWTVERGKHFKLRSPGGALVVCSVTSSDVRAMRNLRSRLERIEATEAA